MADLETIVAYLLGEGELDGKWFGDPDVPLVAGKYKARYWWRTHLREAWNNRHGAGDAEDAAAVLAAMNDGYTVRKGLPSPYLTDEANASFAWIVERAVPPHCDKDGVSMWHSSTPSDAIAEARAAIDAARAGERG